jgi:hypothetical protein
MLSASVLHSSGQEWDDKNGRGYGRGETYQNTSSRLQIIQHILELFSPLHRDGDLLLQIHHSAMEN